jgi:hypothetical protein
MLSLFPELLFLAPLSATVIRIAVSCVFAYSAYTRTRSSAALLRVFAVVDAVIALALLLGMYTQLAALAGLVCAAAWLIVPAWRPLPKSTVALVFVMCASLLVTGAGPLAFDLPL